MKTHIDKNQLISELTKLSMSNEDLTRYGDGFKKALDKVFNIVYKLPAPTQEKITVDNLMELRAEAFIPLSIYSNNINIYQVGINAVGGFIVKKNEEIFTFSNPASAIEKYTQLIQNS